MISTVLNANSMSSLGPLINYCSAYGKEAEKGGEVVLTNGITDYAASRMANTFHAFRESINPRCKHKMKHFIIAHHPLDSARIKANPELEKEILQSFLLELKKQGIDLEPFKFVIYRHTDQAHLHYHMACCNTDEYGRQMKDHYIGLKVGKAANIVSEKYGLHLAVPENVQRQESASIRMAQMDPNKGCEFRLRGTLYHITPEWEVTCYPRHGEPIHQDLGELRKELLKQGAQERELREMDWQKTLLAKRAVYLCENLVFCMNPSTGLPNIKLSSICMSLVKIGIGLIALIGTKERIDADLKAMHKRSSRYPVINLTDLAKQRESLAALNPQAITLDANTSEGYGSTMESHMNRIFAKMQEVNGETIRAGATVSNSRLVKEKGSHRGETRRQKAIRLAKERKKEQVQQTFNAHFTAFRKSLIPTIGNDLPSALRTEIWLKEKGPELFGQNVHLYHTHIQDSTNHTICDLPQDYVLEAEKHFGTNSFKCIGNEKTPNDISSLFDDHIHD